MTKSLTPAACANRTCERLCRARHSMSLRGCCCICLLCEQAKAVLWLSATSTQEVSGSLQVDERLLGSCVCSIGIHIQFVQRTVQGTKKSQCWLIHSYHVVGSPFPERLARNASSSRFCFAASARACSSSSYVQPAKKRSRFSPCKPTRSASSNGVSCCHHSKERARSEPAKKASRSTTSVQSIMHSSSLALVAAVSTLPASSPPCLQQPSYTRYTPNTGQFPSFVEYVARPA